MYIVEEFYKKILKKEPPYYAKYSFVTMLWKPIRKYLNVVIIPNVPFTKLRVAMYRWIGYSIGKNVFIGMKCYLDDVAIDKMVIEDNVTISYGCYFACHGIGQKHTQIIIKKRAYIGMRCNVVSGKNGVTVGYDSIVAAGSLVNKDVEQKTIVAGVPIKKITNEN